MIKMEKMTIQTFKLLALLIAATLFSCSQPQQANKKKEETKEDKPVKKEEVVKEEEKKGPSALWANFFTEGYTSTWKMTATHITYPDGEISEEVLAENPELGKERTEITKSNVTVRVKSVVEQKPGLWKAVITASKPCKLEGVWYSDGRSCWSENFVKKGGKSAFSMVEFPSELTQGTKRVNNCVTYRFGLNKKKASWQYSEDQSGECANPNGFSVFFSETNGISGYTDYLENHYDTDKTEMWLVK
jgi:hypothetical protein